MWIWWLIILFTKYGLVIFFVCLAIGLIVGIPFAIKLGKRKAIMENTFSSDERFLNAKTFISNLNIPIKVSEKGYIGIIDHFLGEIKVINIKDITDYELQINENKNTFDSIFGSFGKIEKKINSLKIILKMDNFDEPMIEIPFISSETDINSDKYYNMRNEINQFIATLDYLRNNIEKDIKDAG